MSDRSSWKIPLTGLEVTTTTKAVTHSKYAQFDRLIGSSEVGRYRTPTEDMPPLHNKGHDDPQNGMIGNVLLSLEVPAVN